MIQYPDVRIRAQAELDAVVGRDRLPKFEDKDKLPYIVAIVRETLRWRPVGPLGEWAGSEFTTKLAQARYDI
jgi:cytochrome P450